MANSIEIPVTLGLEQAQAQAEILRKILQESVKPDSSEYKAIVTMLDKAVSSAEKLKVAMNSSLKTSSGSKKFNNDLQRTFELLDLATSKLKNVSGKNLILSDEDTAKVKDFNSQITDIETQISKIKSGKIGNFFDDSTKEGFQQVKDFINTTGQDINKLTFSGLSKKLNEELESSNKKLQELQDRIQQINQIMSNPILNNSNSFVDALKDVTKFNTKNILTPESIAEAQTRLMQYYQQSANLFDSNNMPGFMSISAGTDMSKAIDAQISGVYPVITEQAKRVDEAVNQYKQAINRLTELQSTNSGRADKRTAEAKNIMEQLGFTNIEDRAKGGSVATWIEGLKQQLQEGLNHLELDSGALDAFKIQLRTDLEKIFSELPMQQTSAQGFKSTVTNWLKGMIGDEGLNNDKIQAALGASTNNLDSYFQNLSAAVREYSNALGAAGGPLASLQAQEQQEVQTKTNLIAASQAVSTAESEQEKTIVELKNRIEELEQKIQDLVTAQQEVHKHKITTDPGLDKAKGQYNQTTEALNKYSESLGKLESRQKALGNIQMAVSRWMGFYQVLNLGKRAIQDMKNHIQELDQVMTKIAVVTNMSQDDLWGQIKQYSEIARQYGVAIKGVYEVSQIYYQQGLNKGDVMNLTTETLKMARISGLDYATAADYMTTAIRGFKLEMSDAAHVTDVYSALAAKTASSTEELAVAISKTASSAEAVGSSFEATSAMMATMIATTRESATNIGTALKSVISRYGEMTSDPSKLVDSEGEEMSLNRVDKALKTVGITIQDVNGQFRAFDDVILELGEKWDTLDKNSQRYIATLMAGNRQQSRFLALVGNVDEYKRALEIAQNSENAGELQTLKTLDSIDAKMEKMKVSVQEFYTSSGIQDLYKGILDTIANVIDAANDLPKVFGKIPASALVIGAQVVAAIKNVITLIIRYISAAIDAYKTKFNTIVTENIRSAAPQAANAGREIGERTGDAIAEGLLSRKGRFKTALSGIFSVAGAVISTFAAEQSVEALNDYGSSINELQDQAAGNKMQKAGGLQLASAGMSVLSGAAIGGLPGALMGLVGAIPSLVSGITSLTSANNMLNVSLERQLELSNKRVENARQESVKAKGEVNDLQSSINKLKQLEEAQYDSADAMEEYITYRNQLAETYPSLLAGYDSEYNAVIKTSDAYQLLAEKINEALEKQLEYDKQRVDQAKIKSSAAKTYQEKEDNNLVLTGYYNVGGGRQNQIKITSDRVDRDRYFTKEQWADLGLDFTKASSPIGESPSWDVTEFKYNNISIDKDKLFIKTSNNQLYKEQYYLIHNLMEAGGAFTEAFSEVVGTLPTQAKNAAEIGDFSTAIDFLLKARQNILDSAQQYTEAQEQLTTAEARQTIALVGFTSKMANGTESQAKILSDFYNNNILRSLFSSTIARANIDENNIVAVPEGYGDTKLNLEDYGRLLGEKIYNIYYSLTETNQKKLDNIIKNRADYASFEEYQAAIIELFGQDLFSHDIWEGQKKAIEQETKNASERMTKYVEDLKKHGFSYKDAQAFEQLFTRQGDNLSYAYTDAVIKDMEYYISQIDNGMIIYGNNISDLIYKYWDAVGKISDANTQIKVSSMLRGIDRQDINEIDKLINTLENEEGYDEQGETGQVVKALKEYRDALNVSINTMTQEFIGRTKDAEKSIEDLSKIQKSGFSSFEDMSKAFQALESAGFTGTWAEAFVLDEGVWKYSAEGYKTAIGKINATIEKDKEKLKTEIENLTGAQELITNSTNGVDFFTVSNYNYVKKMLDKSDSQGIKGALKALYKITDEATLDQLTDQITSGIIPLGNSMEEFHNNILTWIKNQLGDATNQINGADQFIANLKFSQIDFNAIASGTANKDLTISQIQDALVASGKQETEASTLAEYIWDELIAGTYDTLKEVAPFLITDSFKDSLRSGRISKYQTAISETLNASTAPVSAATAKLLEQADKAHQKIDLAAVESIAKAKEFLDTIADLLSIEDYNKSAREILEKSLAITDESETQGNVYKAIDFATGNLDISSFETLANNFGAKLSDWFNLETGGFEWFDEEGNQIIESVFKDILSYNKFTGQFDIVGTVDEFIDAVAGATDTIITKGTAEYAQLYSDIVDKKITAKKSETTAISKQIEQMQSLASAKIGDILNVSYLDDILTGPMIQLLQQAGVVINDGIATITENFKLGDVLGILTSIDTSGSVQLANAVEELKDSIVDMINNWTSLISNGIEGKLTNAGKNELQQIAKDYLNISLDDTAFTRTKDGLKLSQQAAINLYTTLKKVDEIAAEITFEDLNKSLQDNNEHYKNVSDIMNRIKSLQDEIAKADGTVSDARRQEYEAELAVAKEILAVRSTSEDSSFDFMSNKIPGGQNNPLNYYNSWQKAIKTIEEGVKVKGKKNKTQYAKGFIDYQDFYNIATEMNNLAKISSQKFVLAGTTLDGSMEAASKLIQKGAASLQAVDTGELKVNLKSVGLDILGGANSLSEGVDAGIHAMAQSQIDMLDSLISLLETIVAMEDLGDVAGEDMEIELPDIQVKDETTGKWSFTPAFEKWRKAKLAEIKEGKTGFAKAAKDVKIAGKSLADIIAQKAGEWTNDQAKILNSLWKAAKNGDWDVDNVAESMKKVLADAGLGDDANLTIDVGDTHYIVQGGAVVESINFKSAGAKKSLDKLTRKGGKFAGDVEKAKKYIIDQVDTFNKGGKSKVPLDYTLIAEATGVLKYDKKTGKSYVMFNGEKFEGKNIATALRGRKLAKELGKSFKDITVNKDKGIASTKVTVKGEQELTFDVTMGKNNKATWSTKYNNNTYTGNSKSDVLKKIYNAVTKKDENGERVVTEGEHKGEKLTFEQWANLEYNIKVKTSEKFYNGNNQEVDVTKNAKLQQKIRDFLAKTNDEITNLVTDHKNGTSTITLGGYTMKVDTDSIKMGGNINADLVRQKLMKALGLDTLLVESITQGIVGALPSISKTLGDIGSDAKATTGLKKVADSVKTLADSFTNLKKINLVNLKKNLSQFFKNLAETSKQTGKNPLSIDELTAGLDNLIISSIGDISLAEVEEGSEESSSLVLPELTADLISLIISSIADVSLDEVEEGEDSNVSPITELKAALTTLLISSVGGAQLNDEGLATLANKDLGTISPAGIVAALTTLLLNSVGGTELNDEGLATLANKDLGAISPTGIVATLNSLGINTVEQLAQAAGISLPANTDFGTITPENVHAQLTSLGITTIGDLVNAVNSYPDANWGSLSLPVTAALATLGITSVGDVQLNPLQKLALLAYTLDPIGFMQGGISSLLINTVGGAQLTEAGQAAASEHTVTVNNANGHAETFNLDNTTATSENGVITITGITTASGEAATLTITKVTGSKTLKDTDNISAGEVKANATGAEVTADKYKIQWKTKNPETGEDIIIDTIEIPASLNGVDISKYFDEKGYYTGQDLTALVAAIIENITSTNFDNWYEANKVKTIDVQINNPEDVPPTDADRSGSLGFVESKNRIEKFINGGYTEEDFQNEFSFDSTTGIYTDLATGMQWTIDLTGQITQVLPPAEEPEPLQITEEVKEIKQPEDEPEPIYYDEDTDERRQKKIEEAASKLSEVTFPLDEIFNNLQKDTTSIKIEVENEEDLQSLIDSYSDKFDISPDLDLDNQRIELQGFLTEEYGIDVTIDTKSSEEVVEEQIDEVADKKYTADIQVSQSGADIASAAIDKAAQDRTVHLHVVESNSGAGGATGNVSLATGNAMSQGTLMGELGPELVVSKGRYFVVGQNGAEFVNLDKDAIVFNHLQTQSLLKNGKAGRGKPQTNERNATSFATGNVNGGPALASASSALSALKQLRAMWQSLLDASVQDMASKAGSGGGGGGGGKDNKGFMKEVERWYTLMQRIAQLEKDINYQEQLRNKIMSDRNGTGKQYWLSQKKSLNDLGQEISYQKELAISQQAYFEKRRAELNKQSGFSKLYTFDASGQLVYNDKAKLKNGKKGGLSFLSDLFATNTKTGAAKYTDKQKYNKLIDAGLVGSKVYDENGNLIKKPKKGAKKEEWDTYYTEVVKAFSSKMDADKEEMQKLHDSIDDANEKVLELEQQRNEILNEMRDKYLELEEQVFNAVKELRQRAIDELQDLKDATEKSNQRYLDGLNAALQREQNMYQKNESQNDLDKMRRQLAILQRSGGSASQVASLQNDIRSKEKDQYFDERQSQIDAIQKASDNQIKKMDQQIEIMQKTLDYQVKYGLLWKDVADIMKKSPKEIADFIKTNTSEYWGKSPDALNKANDELSKLIDYVAASNQQRRLLESVKQVDEQWKGSATTVWDKDKKQWKIQYNGQGTEAALKKQYSKKVWDAAGKAAKQAYYEKYNKTGDPKAAAAAAKKVLDEEKKKQEPVKKDNKDDGKKDGDKGDNKGSSGAKTIIKFHYKGKYTGANIQAYTSQSWKAGQRISYGAPPSSLKYKGKTIKVLGGWQSGNKNVPKSGSIAPSSNKTWKLIAYYDDAGLDPARSQAGGWQVKYTDPATKKTKIVHYSFKNNGNLAKSRAEAYAKKYKGAKVTKYATGGMVDYTGLAQVDGTPSKPEAFLNAKQTEVLKKGLLGGKNSLVSILADFQAMIDSTSHTSTSSNEPSIVIENATVQMNVQKINNDYDARRAGEQALEEMLKIARKTGATSVSRR